MRLDLTLSKSSPIYLGPKNLITILMHWISVKLADNFEIREHSWPCMFHIKWGQSRQQNPTFVSWLIQKKSGKTPLETIPLYINLTALGRHIAEMPVAMINRKIYQIAVLKIAKYW